MPLSTAAQIVGMVMLVLHLPLMLAPEKVRNALAGFPRNSAAARILVGVDLFWVAWVVLHASLGRFEFLKPGVYVAAPVAYLLLVFFLDELLAARAVGGLFLLLANPVLNIARWHESDWRLVMPVLAYSWVIVGIVLVLSPFRFRHMADFLTGGSRARVTGFAGVAVGLFVLALSLFVY
ncbi:MAG: hypothetical protein KJ626_00640 [Verrucomicrobia bacterium]|nr:hypothetical protein [Verrucomicrobiota bacterium]